jgi:hypothetical protein
MISNSPCVGEWDSNSTCSYFQILDKPGSTRLFVHEGNVLSDAVKEHCTTFYTNEQLLRGRCRT